MKPSTPGGEEYSGLVSKMQTAGIDVLFLGGLHRETGLIFRQAHDRGYDLQLVSSSSSATEDFPMIAGPGLVTSGHPRPWWLETVNELTRPETNS